MDVLVRSENRIQLHNTLLGRRKIDVLGNNVWPEIESMLKINISDYKLDRQADESERGT